MWKREEGGNIKLPNATELAPSREEAIDFSLRFAINLLREEVAAGRSDS